MVDSNPQNLFYKDGGMKSISLCGRVRSTYEVTLYFTLGVIQCYVYGWRKEKIFDFLYDIHLKGYVSLVVYCVEGTSPSIYSIYKKIYTGVYTFKISVHVTLYTLMVVSQTIQGFRGIYIQVYTRVYIKKLYIKHLFT